MALFKKDVLQTAEKLVQKGKIEAAIKEYKKVVAKSPGDTNTLNRVGDLYVRLRKHQDAVEYYMKTAERYALDGFYVKAIAVYKKVQRIDPGAVEVHGRLADLYAKQGLINEARSHFNQLADHHLRNNDSASAIGAYEKIINLDPDNPTPLLKLADLYRENKQPDKATEAYERIATMMIQRGQVDHAIQVYERALRIESGNLDFVSQAVLKIRDAGGVERALDLVARAEQHNPAASELRGLVTSPQTATPELPDAEALASLDQIEEQPVEQSSDRAAASSEVSPPSPEDDSSELEVILDLDEDLESEQEESRPALVDPSTFEQTIEEPEERVAESESARRKESRGDLPPPPEPFTLQRPPSKPSESADAPPETPPTPVPPQPPGAPERPSTRQSDGQDDTDVTVDIDTSEDALPEGGLVPELTSSGEFDLGEIGELGELASADETAWKPSEEPDDQEPLELDADGDLDAAFDRQVDPGPIDIGRVDSELTEASSETPDVDTPEKPTEAESATDTDAAESQAEAEEMSSPEVVESAAGGEDAPGGETSGDSEPEPEAEDPLERGLEEKLSEASVFKKYGLLDKALDRLNEVLALVPDHLQALSEAIKVLVERGDEARAATKAETLHLLCAQRDERDLWDETRELLEGEGYQVEGDRVRTPGELTVAQTDAEPPTSDPYDDPTADDADEEFDSEQDFSALASEPLATEPDGGHDMLDSKEFPVQKVPRDPESEIEASSEREDVDEEEPAEDDVAAADDDTPGWLDEEEPGEADDAQNLFDEEEEFFDLASELQDELGTDLTDLEESLPENAAEQSLEEIVEGFKRGVAENISEEESDTHYNLGIAYREMMLLDEAISEFQISAKSDDYMVDSCAMLGLCFREKGLPDLAAKWYRRALEAPSLEEEQRVGLLYELGDSLEAAGERDGAREAFTQVAAMSAKYRQVEQRLEGLSS